ncbi:MAG: HEAT repeat domain-containing protein [Planctomycetota bacterium]|jgi:HEAT repeat protein|nr:HEAT repeat domain-containing protein [Planctomycetota bacterium]
MKAKQVTAGAAALLALTLFWAGGAGAAESRQEVLSNADVMGLVRVGLAPDVVNAKIRTSRNSFDTSSRALIRLKESNMPDSVIQAMLAASADPALRVQADDGRIDRELYNIASGDSEAREFALAWFLANRDSLIDSLRRRLAGSDPDARGAAALTLGRLGDSESLPSIRNLLNDQSSRARALTAEALALLNDRPAVTAAEQAVIRQIEPLDGQLRLVGYAKLTPSAEAVGKVLGNNSNADNRVAAAWALGEIGRGVVSGRGALEKALANDTTSRVRRASALALAKFHDSRSAEALQNACRADPEVRKTILVALAEYPEAIGFLVEVMNIPPDQIAADETAAARASLVRLTGRDYGLDGSGWTTWLAQHGGSLTPPAAQSTAMPASGLQLAGLDAFPFRGGAAFRSPSEVDLEAWAIVADSASIPTTPPSGALAGTPPVPFPGGLNLSPPPNASSYAPSSPGFAFSAPSMDASGSAALVSPASGIAQVPFAPSHIPEVDIPESESSPGGLRTWSSDPGRMPRPRTSEPEIAPEMRTWSSDPSRIAGGSTTSASPPSQGFAPTAPTAPATPRVADAGDSRFSSPGLPATQPSSPPGGISLPPPPGGITLPPPPSDMSDFQEQSSPFASETIESGPATLEASVEFMSPVGEAGASDDPFGLPAFEPSALDANTAEAGGEIPVAELELPASEPFTSPYFVDPEPGQVVIGDPIIFPDRSIAPADENPPWYSREFQSDDVSTAINDSSASGADSTEPYFAPAESEPFAAPFSEESVTPAAPVHDAATPDAPPGGVSSTPEIFVDPSRPLPPVKEEGLIKPRKGQDMPPMLGEGFK